MNTSAIKRIAAMALAALLAVSLFPITAWAVFASISHENGHAHSDQGHFTGTNFTYTVGETVSQMFKCNGYPYGYHSLGLSSGSLPSGLGLSEWTPNFSTDGFILISGTATEATSSVMPATISATNQDSETGALSITFTINKASPAITPDSAAYTHGIPSINDLTVSATLTNAFFGGATPSMSLTAP